MTFASGQAASLVVLFVLLPVVVGVTVMVLIGRKGPTVPAGARTSELLASGERADAEVLAARPLGSPVDLRPMVEVRLQVFPDAGEPFELRVVQSMSRRMMHELQPGTRVEARLGLGRTVGAVVPPD